MQKVFLSLILFFQGTSVLAMELSREKKADERESLPVSGGQRKGKVNETIEEHVSQNSQFSMTFFSLLQSPSETALPGSAIPLESVVVESPSVPTPNETPVVQTASAAPTLDVQASNTASVAETKKSHIFDIDYGASSTASDLLQTYSNALQSKIKELQAQQHADKHNLSVELRALLTVMGQDPTEQMIQEDLVRMAEEQRRISADRKLQEEFTGKLATAGTAVDIEKIIYEYLLKENPLGLDNASSRSYNDIVADYTAVVSKAYADIENDPRVNREEVKKFKKLFNDVRESFDSLDTHLNSLANNPNLETLATVEKILGRIATVANALSVTGGIVALSVPGALGLSFVIAGGIALSGGTILIAAGTIGVLLLAAYAIVHVWRRSITEKIGAEKIRNDVVTLKQMSGSLFAHVSKLLQKIQLSYTNQKVQKVINTMLNQTVQEAVAEKKEEVKVTEAAVKAATNKVKA
jgi:hypothetical protein